MVIVLDASALVEVVANRPDKDVVLGYLDQPLVAPWCQLAEVGSAVTRLAREGELDSASASRAIREAAALVQEQVDVDVDLLFRVLGLGGSLSPRLPFNDAIYVALAEQRKCPLLTTDERLARPDLPCEVILARKPVRGR